MSTDVFILYIISPQMKRRDFLKATAALGSSSLLPAQSGQGTLPLQDCVVLRSPSATAREIKACSVLVEEVDRRCGLTWSVRSGATPAAGVTIYAATRANWKSLGPRPAAVAQISTGLKPEGYMIQTGTDSQGQWIAIAGADERGLLFGVGKMLQSMAFRRQHAEVDSRRLNVSSSPKYPLRGHQLGYRPKTNAY